MKHSLLIRRVAVLGGFLKWAPVLAIPFGVFLFETWLQVRIYENDYAASELKRKIKEITSHNDRLKQRADDLMAIRRVNEQAPDLGLVPIAPGQVEVLYVPQAAPERPLVVDMEPLTIADAAAPQPRRSGNRFHAP